MENTGKQKVEKVTKTLNISLPFGSMPMPIRIITLLTTVGGLGIMGGVFADIVTPQEILLHFYLLRVITGAGMLVVSYGLVKKKEWSLWVYAGFSILGLLVNPVVAIIPTIITAYLYTHRDFFTSGSPVMAAKNLWQIMKSVSGGVPQP